MTPPSRPTSAHALVVRGLAVALLALMLAGCGKKGEPQPPPGVPHTYPRPYPSD